VKKAIWARLRTSAGPCEVSRLRKISEAFRPLPRIFDAEVVGQARLDARRAARQHRHQIAVVQQVVRNVLNELAHVRRVLRLEVHVVDEDEEHAPGHVLHRALRRQHDAFGRRHRRCRGRRQHVEGAAAVHERERRNGLRHVVFEHDEIVLREVRHEAAVLVARDDVGRDRRDTRPEGGLGRRRRRLGGGTEHGTGHAESSHE
jgi:hypothetical protein